MRKCITILVLLIISNIFLFRSCSEANETIDVSGKVLKRYDVPKGHHRSTRITNSFIMVIQTEYGVIDREVSASTFYQFPEGSYITLLEQPKAYLIKYDNWFDRSWPAISCILLVFSVIGTIITLCILTDYLIDFWKERDEKSKHTYR